MFSVFNLILFIRTCLHWLHLHPFIPFPFYYLLTYSFRPFAGLVLIPPPGCDSSSQQSSCDCSTPRPRHAFLHVAASQEQEHDLLAGLQIIRLCKSK
ncbi:hypothetical protein C8R43DRAFT_1010863 [Mycena crocata]|nr:hypothetical protein C8R43DRAFT_1010863 [Mycena crocata]